MPVRCGATIRKPDGSAVLCKTSMVYLGGIITASGDTAAEIGRILFFLWGLETLVIASAAQD